MMMNPNEFLDLMEGKKEGEQKEEKPKGIPAVVRFGYVDPAYTTGRPRIIFDINDDSTIKEYTCLGNYTPVANDRVIVLNNVVLNKIV